MNQHVADDLPRLLTGEANRDVVLAAAEHLRTCPDCQQELVSAVVAHAALSSAQRFAPDVVAPVSEHAPQPAAPEASLPLPDLAGVFAQVRAEAETEPARPVGRRRLVVLAAAAAVVVGAGTTVAVVTTGSDGPSSHSIAMVADDSGARTHATLTGARLRLDASALPRLDAHHQYEVWLTRPGLGHAPQSIGFVDASRHVDLTIPPGVLTQYNGIAISEQGAHQIEYSGVRVMHSAADAHLD